MEASRPGWHTGQTEITSLIQFSITQLLWQKTFQGILIHQSRREIWKHSQDFNPLGQWPMLQILLWKGQDVSVGEWRGCQQYNFGLWLGQEMEMESGWGALASLRLGSLLCPSSSSCRVISTWHFMMVFTSHLTGQIWKWMYGLETPSLLRRELVMCVTEILTFKMRRWPLWR